LALTNFDQFRTSLNECFDRSKDGIGTKIPFFPWFFVDNFNDSVINLSPPFSALNGVVEILHAILNISIEHIIDVDFCLASLDDLVGNFAQKARNSFT
jgi:hypothetical protein